MCVCTQRDRARLRKKGRREKEKERKNKNSSLSFMYLSFMYLSFIYLSFSISLFFCLSLSFLSFPVSSHETILWIDSQMQSCSQRFLVAVCERGQRQHGPFAPSGAHQRDGFS